MSTPKQDCLSVEFTQRYFQLLSDGKCHFIALAVVRDEFIFKIIEQSLDCFHFIDGSACDWMFGDWHIAYK